MGLCKGPRVCGGCAIVRQTKTQQQPAHPHPLLGGCALCDGRGVIKIKDEELDEATR